MSCRINKGRKWTARLEMEISDPLHQQPGLRTLFHTYTYSDENIPKSDQGHDTLSKKAFQAFLKESQRVHGAFRYFAVGEYGAERGRPHYHMLVFGEPFAKHRAILESWTGGFWHYSHYRPEHAGYVCGYTTKKLTDPSQKNLRDREPEFRCSTRRPYPIGHRFLDHLARQYEGGHAGLKAFLDQYGDVARVIRPNQRILPLDDYCLRKLRTRLGIPLTHTERMDANPNYAYRFPSEEAEICEETAEAIRRKFYAKAKRKEIWSPFNGRYSAKRNGRCTATHNLSHPSR